LIISGVYHTRENRCPVKSLENRSSVTIQGSSGVGKTSLASEVARACLDGRPGAPKFDHVFWISANKPGQRQCFEDLIRALVFSVGKQGSNNLESNVGSAHKLSSDRSILIIVDNYEAIDDLTLRDWIINLPCPSRTIIVKRLESKPELPNTTPLTIERLELPDAEALVLEQADTPEMHSYPGKT
jgi:hypothetical protein